MASILTFSVLTSAWAAEDNKLDGLSAMDQAFYEATYNYACGNVSNAYQILDEAMVAYEPTPNCTLYLTLYRACYDLMMGHPRPVHWHCAKSRQHVEVLENASSKSVTDLVKLAIKFPPTCQPVTGACDPEKEQKYRLLFENIIENHSDSPWAEWARWRLIDIDFSALARKMGDQYKYYQMDFGMIRKVMMAEAIKNELVQPRKNGQGSIMRKWMFEEISSAGASTTDSLRQYYEAGRMFNSTVRVSVIETVEKMKEAFLGSRPKEAIAEENLRRVFLIGRGESVRPEQRVWEYFECVREQGIPLPRSIPTEKSVFLEKTRGLSSMERIWARPLFDEQGLAY